MGVRNGIKKIPDAYRASKVAATLEFERPTLQHSTSPPPPPVVAAKPVVPVTNTTLNTTLLPKPPGLPGVTPAATPLLAGKGTAPETTAKQSTMESYLRTYVPTRKKAMQIAVGVLLTGVAVGGLGWYLQNNRNSYLGSTNQTGDTRNSSYGPDRHGTSRTQAPSRVHYARDTYPTGHHGVDPTASSYQGYTRPSATPYQQAPAPIIHTYHGNPETSTSFPTDNASFQPVITPVNIPISANTEVLGTLASEGPAYHATTPIIPAYSLPTDSPSYVPSIGPAAPTFDHNTINTNSNTFPAPGPPYELPSYTGPIQTTYNPTEEMYGRSQAYPSRSNFYPSGPSMGPSYGYPMRSGGGPTYYDGMRPQYRRPMQSRSQQGLIETVGKGVGSVGSKVADGVGGILSGIGGVVGMLGQDADLKTSSTSV